MITRTASLPVPDGIRAWASLAWLSIAALVLYVGQFEETNAYIGIQPIRQIGELGYWLIAIVWLGTVALLFPWRVRSPIDVFLCLYLLGTGLWSATYWPATGLFDEAGAVVLAVVLLLPAAAVAAARAAARLVRVPVPVVFAVPHSALIPTLVAALVLAAAVGYRVAGADAGFDFEEAFLRRLAGRDSFEGHALPAYLMQMCMNGLAPLLAFLGGLRPSRVALIAAFGFAIFSFWLLAAKAPLLNVAILAVMGAMVRTGRIRSFSRWLLVALFIVLAAAVVEMFLNGTSMIAEFGIRRVVLVSSTIQAYFFDALSQVGVLGLLDGGLNTAGYTSPEYYVGANYMGNLETNANTNAFLHQFATAGLWGYLGVVIGTAVFLFIVEVPFLRSGRTDGFALAAMLGILLVEQALTTALISSGLILCLVLSSLCRGPAHAKHPPRPANI